MSNILNETVAVKVHGLHGNDLMQRLTVETLWSVQGVDRKFAISVDDTVIAQHADSDKIMRLRRLEDEVALLSFEDSKYIIKPANEANGVTSKKVLAVLHSREFLMEDGSIIHLPNASVYKRLDVDSPTYESAINMMAHLGYDDCGTALVFDVFDRHVIRMYYSREIINNSVLNLFLAQWGNYGGDFVRTQLEGWNAAHRQEAIASAMPGLSAHQLEMLKKEYPTAYDSYTHGENIDVVMPMIEDIISRYK